MPKKDFRFFVRHTLGPWTPAFWTCVYEAVKEGDVDLTCMGRRSHLSHGVTDQGAGGPRLQRLTSKINTARHQLNMSFYRTLP